MHKPSILIALTGLLLVGCETGTVVESESEFSDRGLTHHRMDLVLKDIPLPADYTLTSTSFGHGSPTFRYGELNYSGPLMVDELFFYYQRAMGLEGWSSISQNQGETQGRMAFEKEAELCTILIKEGGRGSDMRIIIEQKKT